MSASNVETDNRMHKFRGIYDRKYHVIDVAIQANKLTHILYAFANLREDGTVFLGVSEFLSRYY